MPNRILREGILTSERVDQLSSWASECFYRRLHSVIDDFGRYYAKPELLRAACFPLKLDKVSNADVDKWLADCAGAGLVSTYEVDGKRYLQLLDFKQQVRADKSKFPQMPSERAASAAQMPSEGIATAHLDVDVVVDVVDNSIVGQGPTHSRRNGRDYKPLALEVLRFLNEKTGRAYRPVPANLGFIVARLKEGATVAECRQVVAKKSREWSKDAKMSEYLRPATLFNATKFAQYVGELVVHE